MVSQKLITSLKDGIQKQMELEKATNQMLHLLLFQVNCTHSGQKQATKVNLVYTGGTIKINGVNHTNSYTMTCTFKNASTTYSLPTTSQVMRTGYKFVAWYDNEECTGKILTKITIDNVSDMTLYAKWRVDSNHSHK